MSDSRISGFYKLPLGARIAALEDGGWLSPADANALRDGRQVLGLGVADKMIENVIGTFALPLAVAPNFLIDGRDYVVPLVVEEPSIVAALSSAARLARAGGGFETHVDEALLIGQVHIAGVKDPDMAARTIRAARTDLRESANRVHPRLLARGGGVRDVDVHRIELADESTTLAVHFLVDTCDAMGANLVNSICEAMAPEIAALCDGEVALRILSNLADRALVTARVRYPLQQLGDVREAAERTRDGIVHANAIALADPYRAATHNKGIMNGIDPLAIATGNDWRALEAGAHAYAARDGRYRALTRWQVADNGDLQGEITLPLKPGIVGGTLELNSAASLGLRLCGVQSATELARVMAAVGLAQNFSAIRALATVGIQAGHMRLHARSIVAAAGTPDADFDDTVQALVDSGEIKDWKARQILAAPPGPADSGTVAEAAGKVILFGEHAVVYGKHALAVPVLGAMQATAEPDSAATITIPDWGVHQPVDLDADGTAGLDGAIALIRRELGLGDARFGLYIRSRLPRAMGLGSSAALAVAIVRALALSYRLDVDDGRVNAIAFECEKLAHGTPSGVDNSVATYARPILFRREQPSHAHVETTDLDLPGMLPVVVGCSNSPGLTAEQVAGVRERRARSDGRYDAIFDEMDAITLDAQQALELRDYPRVGMLMNVSHGLLNAIGVSTPELERMVAVARGAGALGAKLTGAGGGGSMLALCPGSESTVERALADAGFRTLGLAAPVAGGVETA